ncbi:estradiol 17-beta-dehydrogenase 11-like [Bolinopsis microptera]|uniref:estradiol 17-beta-dehydrogenase 11-like n=1 Tax=Bolinopsis microptera TaxID=2820187 RepID=UPI00307A6898
MSFLLALVKLPFVLLLEIVYFIFRCRPKKEIKNQHILITGAGQGIGAEFARQFAAMGNTIHCVDIDEKLVENIVDDLKGNGHQAYSYTCDLTKHDQVQRLHDDILGAGFVINILVNNAGVAFMAGILDMSLTQIQHSMMVNIVSNLWLIKLFMPKMLELNEGHIVNIASGAGFFPMINKTDYCSAKAGSIHALNQLRMDHMKTKLKFTAVCPFFVNTKMIAGLDTSIAMSAEHLVTKAIRGIREDKEVILVPDTLRVIKIIQDFAPPYLMRALYATKTEKRAKLSKNIYGQRMDEKIE